MFSTRPLISMSSSPCTYPLVIVPRATLTISTTVTFLFHNFFQFPSWYLSFFSLSFTFTLLVCWDRQVHNSSGSLFLLPITRVGCLAEIRWSVCILKSQKHLCLSFFRDRFLVVYIFFIWPNFNFLHNSKWITLLTQSFLVLYSFCANLLHLLIMWHTISFLSTHNLHLLFCSSYIFLLIIILLLGFFFTKALADGLSLKLQWQQVSSSLQDSSRYSGRSQ